MNKADRVIVVMGATGQQGGATARHLLADGWRVRALVRDVASPKAKALAHAGMELAPGNMDDRASLDAAMRGAYGVFSVQPSAGQPEYGVTSEDEARFGTNVADAAKSAGVRHFIYTSIGGIVSGTGVGHIESKWKIEQHIRAIGLNATLLRPVAFMEILLLPALGLGQGTLFFFSAPDRPIQFIAADDIGKLAAIAFGDPDTHVGKAFDIAGDTLSGNEVVEKLGRAARRNLSYARFPEEILRQNETFRRIVEYFDKDGATSADVAGLRRLHPGLMTFDTWLTKTGKTELEALFATSPA